MFVASASNCEALDVAAIVIHDENVKCPHVAARKDDPVANGGVIGHVVLISHEGEAVDRAAICVCFKQMETAGTLGGKDESGVVRRPCRRDINCVTDSEPVHLTAARRDCVEICYSRY